MFFGVTRKLDHIITVLGRIFKTY